MSHGKTMKAKKGQHQRLLKEALIGDPQAQYDLGLMLANGEGVDKNVKEACVWFESAAKRGHSGAQYLLGVSFLSGVGVERDEWQSLRWLIKSFEGGNAKAGAKVARLIEHKSAALARACWRALALRGSAEAQLALAQSHETQAGSNDEADWGEAVHWYEQAAQQGLAQAQYALGMLYAAGKGVEQDEALALHYLAAAAQQGVASAAVELAALSTSAEVAPARAIPAPGKKLEAFATQSSAQNQFDLALMYEQGFGVPCDHEVALKWYRAAAAQGHGPAQYALGLALRDNDPAEASRYMVAAAQQGHADAQMACARWIQDGRLRESNPFAAHMWVARAAEQGHPQALLELAQHLEASDGDLALRCWAQAAQAGAAEAQFQWGRALAQGHGVALDCHEAAQWLRKAAHAGHPNAQLRLAELYVEGHGVERDWAQAALWLEASADQGDARAQWQLGDLLAQGGYGLPQDVKRAMVLCKLAAKQGFAPAQATLGNLLAQARQYGRAVTWWTRAAEQNDPEALFNLGLALLRGRGVSRGPAQGFACLMSSARRGVPAAQARVGWAYATGEGVVQDLLEAAKWWGLAAQAGDRDAAVNLDRAQSMLSAPQWTEVQRRIAEWCQAPN